MPPLCPRCGKPQSSGILCPSCVSWQAEIDGIRSPFRFEGVIRQAIHQLKYRNIRALALPLAKLLSDGTCYSYLHLFIPTTQIPLAKLLSDYLSTNPVPGEVLVPVPLHPKRLRERGYNQSNLLAHELGKLINLPVIDDCLIRQRHASPQAKTSTVDERRSNVANTFSCRDHRLRGKPTLLIDDVSTSGATLDACATVLKEAEATSVWGLVIAREI